MAKIIQAIQGTPEWHQHRATHYNASDAPAMMGVSSYKSRGDLLRENKTGLVPDVDSETQKRFDKGHEYEAQARPWAEDIIGEELYPVVLAHDWEGLPLSASFDGLTMDDATAFEHKTLNNKLREALDAGSIPEPNRIQMEQQMFISGATRGLFMASAGDREQMRYAWYEHDAQLLGRVLRGWQQFAKDLETYEPSTTEKPVTGSAPSALPALRIELSGAVAESNLDEFREHAIAVFENINTDLQTDNDFADAEETVKWLKDVETRLSAAKDHALSQTADIDRLFKTIDELGELARKKRLDLDKQNKALKEQRKEEILRDAVQKYDKHLLSIEDDLDRLSDWTITFPTPSPMIAQAMKGKRTIATLRDAADTAVANAKIESDRIARDIRANLELLKTEAQEHETLFPDGGQLAVSKSADDLRNLVKARIAEHEDQQRRRAEAKTSREGARQAHEAEDATRRAQGKCDGNHGAPACADPECWHTASVPEGPGRIAPTPTAAAPAPAATATVAQAMPSPAQIVDCVARHFDVAPETARAWLSVLQLPESA